MPSVYIRNTSGSSLDIATIGLVLNKDQVTSEPFDLEDLQKSGEIKKYQQLHFIQLVDEPEMKRLMTPQPVSTVEIVEEVFSSIEQPIAIQKAVEDVKKSLSVLESLLSNKPATVHPVKSKTKPTLPTEETEAGQGIKETASAETSDEDEVIPENPPKGMSPLNDASKRFFGKSPYTQPLPLEDKNAFIHSCNDVRILREIAVFENPGIIKSLAKQKLREVKAAIKPAV